MTNYNLINAAVTLVNEYNEAENIFEATTIIQERVLSWYNNTDITDSEMLAAAAILIGSYTPTEYSEVMKAKEFLFPSPLDVDYYISISEIEMAQMDALWR